MKINDYKLGNTIIRFIKDDCKRLSFFMFPDDLTEKVRKRWETENTYHSGSKYNKEWEFGSMVQIYLGNHTRHR